MPPKLFQNHGVHSRFPPCLFVTFFFFFDSEKPGSGLPKPPLIIMNQFWMKIENKQQHALHNTLTTTLLWCGGECGSWSQPPGCEFQLLHLRAVLSVDKPVKRSLSQLPPLSKGFTKGQSSQGWWKRKEDHRRKALRLESGSRYRLSN